MSYRVWFTFDNQIMDNPDFGLLMDTLVDKHLVNGWSMTGSDMEHTGVVAFTQDFRGLRNYLEEEYSESDPRMLIYNFGCYDSPVDIEFKRKKIKVPATMAPNKKKKGFSEVKDFLRKRFPKAFP